MKNFFILKPSQRSFLKKNISIKKNKKIGNKVPKKKKFIPVPKAASTAIKFI